MRILAGIVRIIPRDHAGTAGGRKLVALHDLTIRRSTTFGNALVRATIVPSMVWRSIIVRHGESFVNLR